MALSPGKHGTFNEINITPLTDIFLVLLIIMMVIAPMFQKMNQDIEIPEINSGLTVKDDDILVAVTKNGEFFLNTVAIKKEDLTEGIRKLKDQTKIKSLVLQADKLTKNKEVIYVMKAAQAAGMEKLTVAGESLSSEEAQKLQQESNTETTG